MGPEVYPDALLISTPRQYNTEQEPGHRSPRADLDKMAN
jgi:hypothetical protein